MLARLGLRPEVLVVFLFASALAHAQDRRSGSLRLGGTVIRAEAAACLDRVQGVVNLTGDADLAPLDAAERSDFDAVVAQAAAACKLGRVAEAEALLLAACRIIAGDPLRGADVP